MKSGAIYLLAPVASALIVWLLGSFIGLEVNPLNWTFEGRGFAAIAFMPGTAICSAIISTIRENRR